MSVRTEKIVIEGKPFCHFFVFVLPTVSSKCPPPFQMCLMPSHADDVKRKFHVILLQSLRKVVFLSVIIRMTCNATFIGCSERTAVFNPSELRNHFVELVF